MEWWRETGRQTITINGAMGAWLLAIAFDLLAAAFVASASDSTALLQMGGGLGGGGRRGLLDVYIVSLRFGVADAGLIVLLGRGLVHVVWGPDGGCVGKGGRMSAFGLRWGNRTAPGMGVRQRGRGRKREDDAKMQDGEGLIINESCSGAEEARSGLGAGKVRLGEVEEH